MDRNSVPSQSENPSGEEAIKDKKPQNGSDFFTYQDFDEIKNLMFAVERKQTMQKLHDDAEADQLQAQQEAEDELERSLQ